MHVNKKIKNFIYKVSSLKIIILLIFSIFICAIYIRTPFREIFLTINEPSKKAFKIGFEFQNHDRMCPWAEGDKRIHKKPIFSVYKGDKKLWELSIDVVDLEFITSPFSNTEENLLDESIRSIELACQVLEKRSNEPKEERDITFKEWIYGNGINKGKNPNSFSQQDMQGLQQKLLEHGLTITINSEALLQNPLLMKKNWVASFKPQVTIQHKLASTISFMVALFVPKKTQDEAAIIENNDGSYLLNIKMLNEIETYDNHIIKSIINVLSSFKHEKGKENLETPGWLKIQNHTKPIDGFLFLHIFTCYHLVNSLTDLNISDNSLINIVLEQFQHGRQVNAKLYLYLLSRRPFSEMWRDIKGDHKETFETLYNERISKNVLDFTSLFKRVNYGATYYDSNEKWKDLSFLKKYFSEPSEAILTLLQNGVISTSMIRQIKTNKIEIINTKGHKLEKNIYDIFNSYFKNILKSIDNPTVRYDFNPDSPCIRETKTNFDVLSPPYFLPPWDAMGGYKNNETIDLSYGEAITEIRNIQNIGTYALDKMEIPEIFRGKFMNGLLIDPLTKQKHSLHEQVRQLFIFVKKQLKIK